MCIKEEIPVVKDVHVCSEDEDDIHCHHGYNQDQLEDTGCLQKHCTHYHGQQHRVCNVLKYIYMYAKRLNIIIMEIIKVNRNIPEC